MSKQRFLQRHFPRNAALALGAALVLSGCANFSSDSGMTAVQNIAGRQINKEVAALRTDEDAALARSKVSWLLKRPLSADAAVQVALLNNRDLQAAYNALGIAEAQRVRASLPPNPMLSLSHVAGSGGFEIERQIAISILSLATLPTRSDIASDRFRQAQLRSASETLRVAMETRRAWVRAVAARSIADFLAQAQSTAQTTAKLAKRLGESGAMNKLDQARNQVFYAEITTQLGVARQRSESARERLVRLMGVWGDELAFRLPTALPPLPTRPHAIAAVEVDAVSRRVDLQIARIELAALAKSYGLSSATRFISILEVAGISKRVQEPGGDPFDQKGVAVDLQIPLFDFGTANLREAGESYMQAMNRLIAKAVVVRSEAREAYHLYRASYDIARHHERVILPLRKIISDETLLRYNAMQIDVFALLIEARSRIQSITAGIEAARDFRLAEVGLSAAVIGGGSFTPDMDMPTPMAAATSPAGHD